MFLSTGKRKATEAVHGPDVQRDATVVTSASEQQRDTARFSSTIYVSRQLRYPSSSTLQGRFQIWTDLTFAGRKI
ncbi:hypothetical protein HZH66_006183 [Vespula vulgaris]|uniref:Uncharacterized protein n=1 Tax=Vespula vulgaris TaxID=7454 RepID=A0A834NAH4_VESVU|nr:hypothetical protein HZH66_006183 [Vespula vulgaris]